MKTKKTYREELLKLKRIKEDKSETLDTESIKQFRYKDKLIYRVLNPRFAHRTVKHGIHLYTIYEIDEKKLKAELQTLAYSNAISPVLIVMTFVICIALVLVAIFIL